MGTIACEEVKSKLIVYGVNCSWWDGIDQVSHTPPGADGHSIPCCPHCGHALFQVEEPEWWASVDKYQADGHEHYRDFIKWLRGKCLPRGIKAYHAWLAGDLK